MLGWYVAEELARRAETPTFFLALLGFITFSPAGEAGKRQQQTVSLPKQVNHREYFPHITIPRRCAASDFLFLLPRPALPPHEEDVDLRPASL